MVCNNYLLFIICSLYLFPCIFLRYVIRLHRLRIGGGDIQRNKWTKRPGREEPRRNNVFVILIISLVGL